MNKTPDYDPDEMNVRDLDVLQNRAREIEAIADSITLDVARYKDAADFMKSGIRDSVWEKVHDLLDECGEILGWRDARVKA